MLYDDAIAAFVASERRVASRLSSLRDSPALALLFGALVGNRTRVVSDVARCGDAGGADDAAPSHHTNRRQLARAVLSAADDRVCPRRVGDRRVSARQGCRGAWRSVARICRASDDRDLVRDLVGRRDVRVGARVAHARSPRCGAWRASFGLGRHSMDRCAVISQRMDPLWASAMAGKDYIFPSDWSASFWLVNLSYLAVVIAIYALRQRREVALTRESGLVAGAAALVALFLCVVAADDRRRCTCLAASDVARVLDARFSCGDLPGVAVRRGAPLVGNLPRGRRGARRRRRRPRSFRVELEHAGSPIARRSAFRRIIGPTRWSGFRAHPPTRTCSPIPAMPGSTARASGWRANATCISRR